jgi:hypothetical protein
LRRDHAECRHDISLSGEGRELHAVEQIEGFGAELEINPLGNRDFLRYRKIEVIDALRAQLVINPRFVPELIRSRGSKASRVEVFREFVNGRIRHRLGAIATDSSRNIVRTGNAGG